MKKWLPFNPEPVDICNNCHGESLPSDVLKYYVDPPHPHQMLHKWCAISWRNRLKITLVEEVVDVD